MNEFIANNLALVYWGGYMITLVILLTWGRIANPRFFELTMEETSGRCAKMSPANMYLFSMFWPIVIVVVAAFSIVWVVFRGVLHTLIDRGVTKYVD